MIWLGPYPLSAKSSGLLNHIRPCCGVLTRGDDAGIQMESLTVGPWRMSPNFLSWPLPPLVQLEIARAQTASGRRVWVNPPWSASTSGINGQAALPYLQRALVQAMQLPHC